MIRTERLLLRAWRDDDLASFAALNADPEVMRYFLGTLDRAQSDALAGRIRSLLDANGCGLWAIEVADASSPLDGRFIGFTGLVHQDFPAQFTPAIEVGWRLSREAWGQGYATEAAREALRVGFEEHGLAEIVSMTAEGNIRSRAVMERIGMSHDPTDDFDHPGVPVGNALRRHVLYRVVNPARGK